MSVMNAVLAAEKSVRDRRLLMAASIIGRVWPDQGDTAGLRSVARHTLQAVKALEDDYNNVFKENR